MSDYYVVKKPDFESIKRINPEVIRCPEQFIPQIEAAHRQYRSFDRPMAIHKN